jgi:hypothetical protein
MSRKVHTIQTLLQPDSKEWEDDGVDLRDLCELGYCSNCSARLTIAMTMKTMIDSGVPLTVPVQLAPRPSSSNRLIRLITNVKIDGGKINDKTIDVTTLSPAMSAIMLKTIARKTAAVESHQR